MYGALKPKKDIRDYKYKPVGVVEIPRTFSLERPLIKNQDSVGSCVAHAMSYINEYHNKKQQHNSDTFSVGFIYGYRPRGYYQGIGMHVREALKTAQKVGNVKLNEFCINEEIPEVAKKVQANLTQLKEKAVGNRISTYFSINDTQEIKSVLIKYGYVLVSIAVYEDSEVDEDNVFDSKSRKKERGYHAIIIYGWNDKGWLFANSWGKDWGDHGCAILPFLYPLEETWGITDDIIDGNIKAKKTNRIIDMIERIINYILNLILKRK